MLSMFLMFICLVSLIFLAMVQLPYLTRSTLIGATKIFGVLIIAAVLAAAIMLSVHVLK